MEEVKKTKRAEAAPACGIRTVEESVLNNGNMSVACSRGWQNRIWLTPQHAEPGILPALNAGWHQN